MKLLRTLILLLLIIPVAVMAGQKQIRVAILDNLQSQKLASINYENDYLKGVELAAFSAKGKGINLQYKYFNYGKEPLDILTEIPKVKAWNPDFIIGPRASDKFLLLKNYFNDVVVLSPLATAEEVYNLPDNFYTLSSSDGEMAKAITQFLYKKFPNTKKIFIIAAIDCKSCYGTQKNISSFYKKINQKTQIVEKQFISTDVQTVDIANMVTGYKPGDIIIIPNLSSVAGVLLKRIVDYLKQPGITFIGTDGWASADVSFVGKIKPIRPFNGYHLSQWSLYAKTKEVENFKKIYYKKFSTIPQDSILYASYTTAMTGINEYLAIHNSSSAREKILKSIKLTVKNNPDKYRLRPYVFYELDKSGERVAGSINPT